MEWSIVGYWKTKKTGLIFPVYGTPDIKTVADFNAKISSSWATGTNNSNLTHVKGTIIGDLIAFGLQSENTTNDTLVVEYKIVTDGKNTAKLGVKLYPKGDPLFYGGPYIDNSPNDWIQANPSTDRYDICRYYGAYGIVSIPDDGKLVVLEMAYVLNYPNASEAGLVMAKKARSSPYFSWIIGLPITPTTPSEEVGVYEEGPLDTSPPPPDPDPPSGDIDVGTDLPGGYDSESDEVPWGVDTWLSAASLGMCTVYNPTVSQVRDLATRLYSKDFQSGFENYIWGNPIESIIGLSVMPCSIPNAGTATVKSWGLDTGVTMNLASNTLVHVDCGQLSVPKVYSGYLDYSPYTQVEIYIPYVGFIGLDADDIMGQTLQLHYYIDIISGSATAKLVISNTSTTTVLGQWSCQVGRQIPVGSRDYNDIINSGIQLVAAAVGAYSGSVIPEVVTDLGDALQYEGGGFNGTRFFTQMLRAGSSAIMQAKPNITRGSSIASASGQLAVQYPYLIIKRPVSAKTNGYGALVGYPTFKYGTIGEYKGFVRCHNIKLDNIGCTDWELSEIFKLCCEGVYI